MGGTSKNARRPGEPGPSAARALAREACHGLLLVLAGASALYVLAYLPSRLKTDALRSRRDGLQKEKARVAAELGALRAETKGLGCDPWAVERSLRRRLGFLRPGERVLKLDR